MLTRPIAILVTAVAPFVVNAHEMTPEFAGTLFEAAQVVGTPEIVECTLSGGAQTQCLSITMLPAPAEYEPGPWCPSNISDGADAGGIWLEGGEV